MEFTRIVELIGTVPIMGPTDGKVLYEFVLQEQPTDLLELGFAHGTSSCYLAAALQELGRGHLTSIDNLSAKQRQPSIIELLERTGLGAYVTPIFHPTSYNWELKSLIARQTTAEGQCHPCFDFCFLDGAHLWDVDGLAFFLVDKLLRPGGWILFDDLEWSLALSPSMKEFAAGLPPEQVTERQVQSVFELLVSQHPDYAEVRRIDNWGWAQKKAEVTAGPTRSADLLAQVYGTRSIGQDTVALLRKIKHRVFR